MKELKLDKLLGLTGYRVEEGDYGKYINVLFKKAKIEIYKKHPLCPICNKRNRIILHHFKYDIVTPVCIRCHFILETIQGVKHKTKFTPTKESAFEELFERGFYDRLTERGIK